MLFLYNTYIKPIAEYGSIIWRNKLNNCNNQIEWIQKEATRYALGSATRPYQNNYIGYEERCNRLNVITLTNRAKIGQIIIIKKLMEGTMTSRYGEILTKCKNPSLNLRRRRTFQTNEQKIARGSPLNYAIDTYHELEDNFHIEQSEQIIKAKLKNYFLNIQN